MGKGGGDRHQSQDKHDVRKVIVHKQTLLQPVAPPLGVYGHPTLHLPGSMVTPRSTSWAHGHPMLHLLGPWSPHAPPPGAHGHPTLHLLGPWSPHTPPPGAHGHATLHLLGPMVTPRSTSWGPWSPHAPSASSQQSPQQWFTGTCGQHVCPGIRSSFPFISHPLHPCPATFSKASLW